MTEYDPDKKKMTKYDQGQTMTEYDSDQTMTEYDQGQTVNMTQVRQ